MSRTTRHTSAPPAPPPAALLLAFLLSVLAAAALPAAAVEESSTRTETFELTGAPGETVRVCNVNGPVTARGVSGRTATVTVRETYRARTPEALERAKREMAVSFERRGGVVEVSVGGPCDHRGHSRGDRDHERDRYHAEHAFEVEIPHGVEADLSTVNSGAVRLSGHRGRFEVANVNGAVEVEEVSGSGKAATVNGPLTVTFAENPAEACSFATVNGEVDLAFRPGLGASFRFQTLNGEIFTDFPFEVGTEVVETSGDRGKPRHRIEKRWSTAVEIGGGGPTHGVTTVNGDVFIRDRPEPDHD